MTPEYDWLATGGSYWVIAGSWFLSGLFYSAMSLRAGRVSASENDGCLLAICSIILTMTGGGLGLYIGLLTLKYPNFVLTSAIGCILLPGIGNLFLGPRLNRRN